jgi:DNA-binding CsgD family transcriptional regulator
MSPTTPSPATSNEPPLNARLWQEVSAAALLIHSAATHTDFFEAVLIGLKRLIPADLYCVHILDRKVMRTQIRMAPENPFYPEEIAYYTANPAEMPLVNYYQQTHDKAARRVSDVIDRKTWLGSRYYQTCMARLGLVHCLSLPVTVDDHTVGGLSLNRRKNDFTLRHCALLNALGPHFCLAWERHPAPWPDENPSPTSAPQARFKELGLSPRETEVLHWMTEGKLNREIATILGISLMTVQKHVAAILRKLQQENRHAATIYALRQMENAPAR